MYDVLIVGGGPAGLTAAIYARRANKSVLLFEKDGFGGQMTRSPKIENYPGFAEVSGAELADHMLEQALALGMEFEIDEVLSVSAEGSTRLVKTAHRTFEGRTVIFAAGAKHRMLGVPGEADFVGNGISFCAVCDGAFYEGKRIAVIGGGNSALVEALMLASLCSHVTILQNLDRLTGEARLCEALADAENVDILLETEIVRFEGDSALRTVVYRRGGVEETLELDGAFISIGHAPENDALRGLTPLDEGGYAVADERCLTACKNVFVAGDCRQKRVRQITTAIADGATAAIAACQALDREDF